MERTVTSVHLQTYKLINVKVGKFTVGASELRDVYINKFYINIGILGRAEWLFKITK